MPLTSFFSQLGHEIAQQRVNVREWSNVNSWTDRISGKNLDGSRNEYEIMLRYETLVKERCDLWKSCVVH